MSRFAIPSGRYHWVAATVTLLIGGLAALPLSLVSAAFAHRAHRRQPSRGRTGAPVSRTRWIAAWTASPAAPPPGITSTDGFRDQTVRNIIFTSAGGTTARVQLANTYGTQPLRIGRASIGVARGVAAALSGTSVPVTFDGAASIVIPPRAQVVSDPVRLSVRPLERLEVSVFLPRPTQSPTQHTDAHQINFIAAGDHALASGSAPFTTRTQSWYFLTAVDVAGPSRDLGTLVALGDSITDGHASHTNANARWPNDLARRLDASPGPTLSVVDAGIGGNRLLTSTRCCGVSALDRFGRDVLNQAGVREVIVLEGVNDLDHSPHVSAAEIIAGYKQLISRAHAPGVKIFGATLTPFKGARYWTPAREAKREAINDWIRTSGAFDGVIDFAGALADPLDPQMLNPAYDCGDHLHPNDAGYQAMANSISIATLLHAAKS